MWQLKSWKGKDKWLFLAGIGAILCILAFPAERLAGKNEDQTEALLDSGKSSLGINSSEIDHSGIRTPASAAASEAEDSYEKQLETRVKEILKHVDGVGEVDVMIVLKSSAEKVIHVDEDEVRSVTEETDSSGVGRKTENQELSRGTVMMSSGGSSEPVIQKELKPELSGIIISAAGGGSPAVRAEISEAMEALFGLPANKIKVLKRVE